MQQQQSGLAVDQEHLLHAVEQAAQQQHFAERFAGAPGFQAPAEAARRDALLHDLVEREQHIFERRGHGLAHRRADYRMQRVGQHARIALHRNANTFFDNGVQREPQFVVAAAQPDGFGQCPADVVDYARRVVQPLPDVGELLPLRPDQQAPQLGECVSGGVAVPLEFFWHAMASRRAQLMRPRREPGTRRSAAWPPR